MATRRVNTLKFDFGCVRVQPSSLAIHDFFHDYFAFPPEQVLSIGMDIYRKCVFLKLLSAPLCERILNDSGGVVKFTDANDTYDIKVTWADTL